MRKFSDVHLPDLTPMFFHYPANPEECGIYVASGGCPG
jgi:hypothetical protein